MDPPDILIREDKMPVHLPFEVKVFFTPGHSRGGVCFLIGDALFSGDTHMRSVAMTIFAPNRAGFVWEKGITICEL